MSKKEQFPYARMIKNQIIEELQKINVQQPGIELNAEFKAGAETMKKFIIDSLKK